MPLDITWNFVRYVTLDQSSAFRSPCLVFFYLTNSSRFINLSILLNDSMNTSFKYVNIAKQEKKQTVKWVTSPLGSTASNCYIIFSFYKFPHYSFFLSVKFAYGSLASIAICS